MKKIAIISCFLLILSGCTSKTQYGDCVGITDEKDPTLVYHVDGLNVAVAVILSETIVVPIVVLASQLQCPVAHKENNRLKKE